MSTRAQTSRRRFLQASAVSLTVVLMPGCALPVIPKRPAPKLEDALGWIRHEAGRYTLWLPRVEMGQNIATALKQIACAELDVPWTLVETRLPSTRDIDRVRATVGSDSIKDYALPLAQACALLREAVATGRFPPQASPPAAGLLRAFRPDSRLIAELSPPLEQGEAIVRGQGLFAADVQLPGLRYGRVLRAPASPEFNSHLARANETAARAVPGFVAIVRDPLLRQANAEGLGIVARTPGALDRIAQALGAQWTVDGPSHPVAWQDALDIDRALEDRTKLPHAVHDGAVDTAGPWDIDLRFDIPPAAHAAMEPRAAVAALDEQGHVDLWVGSQDVFYQRDVVVTRLNLAEGQVRVHACRVGGAFGGKTICTVELEAAVLARAVGQPVKVQWTREQEFRQGFHRAPSSHRVRVRLKDGRLHDWWHAFMSSHILFTNAAMPPWMQRVADVIGDAGVARGAALPYRAATRETRFGLARLPVLAGPWRGLGAASNHFVTESVVDECARQVGQDPVAFRLAHIEDPRLAQVLRHVAALAQWPRSTVTPMAGERRGWGVACGIYKGMSYAAVVAEVVVSSTGQPRVTHMWCAHDCGRVINAQQVRAQCEGNLIWGVGMALIEQLHFEHQGVTDQHFAASPIPRWPDIPSITVDLLDHGHPPTGAGETAIVASVAAIANALRDATGHRLQKLPCRTIPAS
jgi:isoquinoline 1-oxidoreductase beta subunit